MAILWWRHKYTEIGKGTCTIKYGRKSIKKFKKALFTNNIVYEVKRKFCELKQTRSIQACVTEFTTLMLHISNLTNKDMPFNFMDRLQIGNIDETITQVESLMDFKHERHDKSKGNDTTSSHAKGRGD